MAQIPYIKNWNEWREGFSFHTEVKIRFSETDAFGHVNNTNAFVYFEVARLEYLESLGLREDLKETDSKYMCVVADMHCNYLKQITYGDILTIYTKIVRIGRTSIDIHYVAENQLGEACLTARGAIVQINRANGKSAAWSEKQRTILRREFEKKGTI